MFLRIGKKFIRYGLCMVAVGVHLKVFRKIFGFFVWVKVSSVQCAEIVVVDCLHIVCRICRIDDSHIFKNGNSTKYPNIVEFLNTAKEKTGRYPGMMLTEFCSWEGNKDSFVTNPDNQIDQMTQRIQKMEQSDLVEGYAWFMANSNYNSSPYMSAFVNNTPGSELSTLGKVLVYMSSFDNDKYYRPGEKVAAKDYIDATTDDQIVRLRPNTEQGSDIPLQIQLTPFDSEKNKYSAATYLIDVPATGTYTFTLHANGTDNRISLTSGDHSSEMTVAGHPDEWSDYTATMDLTAGKNTLSIANLSPGSVLLNEWSYSASSGISDITVSSHDGFYTVYSLQGVCLGTGRSLSEIHVGKGIYIVVTPDGTSRKLSL